MQVLMTPPSQSMMVHQTKGHQAKEVLVEAHLAAHARAKGRQRLQAAVDPRHLATLQLQGPAPLLPLAGQAVAVHLNQPLQISKPAMAMHQPEISMMLPQQHSRDAAKGRRPMQLTTKHLALLQPRQMLLLLAKLLRKLLLMLPSMYRLQAEQLMTPPACNQPSRMGLRGARSRGLLHASLHAEAPGLDWKLLRKLWPRQKLPVTPQQTCSRLQSLT